jgi:hypothetical protein
MQQRRTRARFSDFIQFHDEKPSHNCVWADFLFELGHQVATAEPAKVKVLLVLPIIDIATPLITLGYLYGKFSTSSSVKLPLDFFYQLPINRDLIYYSSTGPQKAVYEGITEYSGVECVKVRVESKKKGSGSYLLQSHQLHKISVLNNNVSSSEHSIGKNIAGICDFAKLIYGVGNLENIASVFNSAWLIGRSNEISKELNISLCAKQSGAAGNFNDLIRADKFLPSGDPSFSCVESCYKQDSDFNVPPSAAKLAIFREGISYLRQQHHYINAGKIVLMDFADQNCEYIIEAYNQKYLQRGEDWRFEFDHMPDNLICAGYIEAGQA